MNYKEELKIHKFKNVLLLKNFIAISPKSAKRFSLFDNLTFKYKINLLKYSAFIFFKDIIKLKKNKSPNLYSIFNVWSSGYHHFLTETLVKFIIHKDELKGASLLIPETLPKFAIEAFEMLNLTNVTLHNNLTLYKELILIENPLSGHFNPSHLNIFRTEFKQFRKKEPFTKIYISRKKARSRKIINENELTDFLIEKGFKIIETDYMSFQDQVFLFSNSSFLISSHGAGLTNMIFMPENAKIIELMPEFSSVDKYEINKCYEKMSMSLNFDYIRMDCQRQDPLIQFDMCDIYINSEKLKSAINEIN